MEPMILEWKEVATATLQQREEVDGEEVLGYNADWICPDFNPKGIRVCVLLCMMDFSPRPGLLGPSCEEGYPDEWWSAKWCSAQDCWVDVEEAPTHYAIIPAFDPSMLKGAQG